MGRRNVRFGSALAVYQTADHKVANPARGEHVVVTWTGITNSCPPKFGVPGASCAMRDGGGCYGEDWRAGSVARSLAENAVGVGPIATAYMEADAIDALWNGGAVPAGTLARRGITGDHVTGEGARAVDAAFARFQQRGGGAVWGYTHAWAMVPRDAWQAVSMLASCDLPEHAPLARERGWTPAVVVPAFPSTRAFTLPESGDIRWIPCPAQLRAETTCYSCRLCTQSERLYREGKGIAFEAHGTRARVVRERLVSASALNRAKRDAA